MSEAVDQHVLSLTPFDMRPVGATVVRADRQFNIALVVATVVHVLFLTSFLAADVRQLGDPGGAADGISVDFVSEADLKSMGTVADTAAGPPAPPTPPPTSPQQQTAAAPPEPPPPEPQAQPTPEPPPQQTAALPPEPPPPAQQEQPKAASPDQPALLPDPAVEQLLKIPSQVALPHTLDPPKPPEPAKPAQPEEVRRPRPKQQQLRTSSLDLTLPPSFYAAPFGGGGVGFARPAGTTRSGENDAFARAVIAALQRTMPQLRDTYGRVTVRIRIDKDGDLYRTEVIVPSNVSGLDQSVVFATRQASFPFPPRNANDADLTFLVTYIYR